MVQVDGADERLEALDVRAAIAVEDGGREAHGEVEAHGDALEVGEAGEAVAVRVDRLRDRGCRDPHEREIVGGELDLPFAHEREPLAGFERRVGTAVVVGDERADEVCRVLHRDVEERLKLADVTFDIHRRPPETG